MITIYVLSSLSHDKRYVGMTSNLKARLEEHNSKKSKFTSAFTPWRVMYTEFAPNFKEARIREKYLKSAAEKIFVNKKIKEEITGSLPE
jgi:predicted GIY-YIG superfamily endonuclease